MGWAFMGDGNAMSRAQGVAFALRLTNSTPGCNRHSTRSRR